MVLRLTICRFCYAGCGINVEVVEGRVARVNGDVNNPATEGFTCAKGRALPEQHNSPERVLATYRRGRDGELERVASQDALDEVASRLRAIIDDSGPRAVALYTGTGAGFYPAAGETARSLWSALGSPMTFTPATIDQPGKYVAPALHGRWNAGAWPFDETDVFMLVGTNPMVSMWAGGPMVNPGKRLRDGRARGQRLVVVDPRQTEACAFASLHLRPRPGTDAALLASIIRTALQRGVQDREFCDEWVSGLDELQAAVEPFTGARVKDLTGVSGGDVERAVEMLVSSRRGGATAGTGPNMSGEGPLVEYLLLCLYDLFGYWRRVGDSVSNPPVLAPERAWSAEVIAPSAAYGFGELLRGRNQRQNAAGMPTAALADEILLDGPGRVRALICVGGNPVVAWPDQLNTIRALEHLDLFVCLDVARTPTTELAHYLVGTKLSLEVPGVSMRSFTPFVGPSVSGYSTPYAQYSPAIVDPPLGSDVVEEWEWFYALARRLGVTLRFGGDDFDMAFTPTSDEMLEHVLRKSLVPLSDVRPHLSGACFWEAVTTVTPAVHERRHRFQVADPAMMTRLRSAIDTGSAARIDDEYPFRLLSRRVAHVYNSSGRTLQALRRDGGGNPAYLHPSDVESLGLLDGALVEIASVRAQIPAVVASAADVLPGTVSMAHAFGGGPGWDDRVRREGGATNRLVDIGEIDEIAGIPRMSAIPVRITAARSPSGALL
jgi:anaerobic selenocysteine-containing dehydrogenase